MTPKYPRKICVVSGTRADYGLLYWIMRCIQDDPDLELQLIVTSMHLSPEFGSTYLLIEQDGFQIDAKVEMLLSSDSPVGVTKSIGLGTIGMADALARLQPDMLLLLGDRFEALAAAQAALLARVPVAHIHGGEATEGAVDESIRHAITKLAHLHFVAAEPYRKRVVQMGEHPSRVFNFGAPGLENIRRLKLLTRPELEQRLDMTWAEPLLLITYHPATLSDSSPALAMTRLLQALDAFPSALLVMTYPNADTQGREIIQMLETYRDRHSSRVRVSKSLGQLVYLSLMRHANVVIGNSSSGLIEAPAFRVPTVNIGDRQRGRIQAASVIQCEETSEDIQAAISKALSPAFRNGLTSVINPLGEGDTSVKLVEQLKSTDISTLLRKSFYDCPC